MKRFTKILGVLSILVGIAGMSYAVGLTPNTNDMVDYCTGANNSNCIYRLDNTGNVSTLGTFSSSGSGTSSFAGSTSVSGKTIFPRQTVTGISSTTVVTPTATYLIVVSTGLNVTCGLGFSAGTTATPCISTATATDGQYLIVAGTSSVSTVTFADAASAGVDLGASTRLIDNNNVLVLIYDSIASVWREVSFASN